MILNKIIDHKQREVLKHKEEFPLTSFKTKIKSSDRSFRKAIAQKGLNLIAEIKKISPSEGLLSDNFNFEDIARIYEANKKVKAISVLTDAKYFGGSRTLPKDTKKLTKKPILRKDFIIDEYQVYESSFCDADAILLIARILTRKQIEKFVSIAKKYNMDCLVEVHDENDLKKVIDIADIIGINNRNLDTLEVDANKTLELVKKIPEGKIIVSESGFHTKEDVDKVKGKVNALLIGTAFIKAKDINKKINSLFNE